MNISVFSSDEFAPLLKIMLASFCEKNDFEKHNIFIITTNMRDETFKRINKYIGKRFGQKLFLVKLDESKKPDWEDNPTFSTASYHKLYAFNYLPVEVDRIMCLDSDMIILDSIKDYYYQDLGPNILAASPDFYVSDTHKKTIGLSKEEKYVNLGLLLIDLKKYKLEYSIEDYMDWITKYKPIYVAQDVLNVFFRKKIKVTGRKYNYQFFGYKDASLISKAEMKYVQEEVKILHYVGTIKANNFRHTSKLVKYCYKVMWNNGMKIDLVQLLVKKQLFKLKYVLRR